VPINFYYILKDMNGSEVKLWLAFRLLAWRTEVSERNPKGPKKGAIEKSLRQIGREIDMHRSTVCYNMKKLLKKGLVRWGQRGVYLTERMNIDYFDTGFDTAIDTKTPKRTKNGSVQHRDKRWCSKLDTPVLQIGHSPHLTLVGSDNKPPVETTKRRSLNRERASAPPKGRSRAIAYTGDQERTELPREKTRALIQELKQAAVSIKKPPSEKRQTPDEEAHERERIAELKRQAAELEKGEDQP